jgi:hypothetical protein
MVIGDWHGTKDAFAFTSHHLQITNHAPSSDGDDFHLGIDAPDQSFDAGQRAGN